MPIAVTACKASHWVQQCCSMPWHMTLWWAWSACFLPREHGVRGALRLGPCLAPCSVMVMDHAGHTSPQKEQLFTLLMHISLPRLWYCLSSSPSEELCTGCSVFCQAGQLRRQSQLRPRLPPEWTEMATWFASWCLSWQRLSLPCRLTASLYITVAVMSLLLNRHLLQQLEQTNAAVCPASNGGWGAHTEYSAHCWHIFALTPDLKTQGISVLCIFSLVSLATCWRHNDLFTIETRVPSDFLSSTEETGTFSHHPRETYQVTLDVF